MKDMKVNITNSNYRKESRDALRYMKINVKISLKDMIENSSYVNGSKVK